MARAKLNGIEIDYEVGGGGPAVLLSHGYSATLRMWDAQRRQSWTDRSLTKTAAGLWIQQDASMLERQYAAEMLRFLDAQIGDAVNDIPRRMLPSWSDLPPGDRHYNADAEELERHLTQDLSHSFGGTDGR